VRRPWGSRIRVLVAAALIAVVSVATFAVLLRGLQDQRSTAARGRATTDALNSARRLQRLALETQSDARGYLLTHSPALKAAYQRARDAIPPAAAGLARLETDPRRRAEIMRIRAQLVGYARGLDATLAGGGAGPSFAAVDAALNAYTEGEAREQLRARANSNRLRDRAIATATGGLALLLALIALVAYGATRAIVGPVQRLQRFARELGAGRLQTRLPEAGPPETAELAHAFNVAAAELARMQERHLAELDSVFDAAPLGLAFLDPELRVLRVNDALAGMRGMAPEDIVGRPVQEVMLAPELLDDLRRVVETGEPATELQATFGRRALLISYFPVRGEDGQLLAIGTAVSDVTARRRAEAARERLQAATAALAAASTVHEVAAATVAEARRALDLATVAVYVTDERAELLRHVHGLGGERLARWRAIPLSAELPVAEAARSEAPVFASATLPDDDEGALAALPLIDSGRVLGVLALTFRRGLGDDADDQALLVAIAAQSAVALGRAQLFEREHAVAQTLQTSLLPRALPRIGGLDLAGRLEAGAAGVEVGGDFYDAFAIDDGIWGLAIGDVCGKGVDAAALTALARHTLRAAARERRAPSAVLEALNRAVLDESRAGQFLTAVFARAAALGDGRFALTLSCGGHPPPVLLDALGAPRPIEAYGTLLGIVEDPDLVDAQLVLEPGDTLLLYTDGLTEAGAPARTLTTEEVGRLLTAVRGRTAAQTAEGCLQAALAAGGGVTRDDIAVLVAQAGLATPASPAPAASPAWRTAAGESSTRGQ